MTGGDFVRNVKQTIDLLRQIADVAPDPDDRRDRARGRRRVPARRRSRRRAPCTRAGGLMMRDQAGEEWGSPATRSARPRGRRATTPTLAAVAAAAAPGALVRFRPDADSDLARGRRRSIRGRAPGIELPLDVLRARRRPASPCNMVVLGTPPDRLRRWSRGDARRASTVDGRAVFDGRATTVVIATGQFLRGLDLVPRGPPGRRPGRGPGLRARGRRAGRAAAPAGDRHPRPAPADHPAHRPPRSRSQPSRPGPLEIDGEPVRTRRRRSTVEVVPGAYRLLV